jgi:ribosomal protein L12E/L44/L45/RPP1/RPP2
VWKRVPLIARNLQTQAKQSGFAVAAAAGSKALAAKADKQRGQTPHAPSSAQSEKEKENKLKYFFSVFVDRTAAQLQRS